MLNRILSFGVAVSAAVYALCGIAESADGVRWECIIERRVSQPLTYAGFINVRDGITVGVHGAVYYTNDGGGKWAEGLNVSQCRHGLEMLDDGFAWHCGNVSVRRSFNGGRTWYRAADFGEGEPAHARFISFADENRGFVATDRKLGVTIDGGVVWKDIPLSEGVTEIAAVSMSLTPVKDSLIAAENLYRVRKVTGRILDSQGRIWIADDNGGWSEAKSPVKGYPFTILADAPSTAMRFTPEGTGIIAVYSGSGKDITCVVFRSEDNGESWNRESIPVKEPGTLFISPDGKLITMVSDFNRVVRVYSRK